MLIRLKTESRNCVLIEDSGHLNADVGEVGCGAELTHSSVHNLGVMDD